MASRVTIRQGRNVNCGTCFAAIDRKKATFIGACNHSRYPGDTVFTPDLAARLKGNIDRYFIPGRQNDVHSALHLQVTDPLTDFRYYVNWCMDLVRRISQNYQ